MQPTNTAYITFVKLGQQVQSQFPKWCPFDPSLFTGASDWMFLFDLYDSYTFQPHITILVKTRW